jgi:hypothetical protein
LANRYELGQETADQVYATLKQAQSAAKVIQHDFPKEDVKGFEAATDGLERDTREAIENAMGEDAALTFYRRYQSWLR